MKYKICMLLTTLMFTKTLIAQKKSDPLISIGTLMYSLNQLHIQDADAYFLKKGYKYGGVANHGDTITYRYKKSNSPQSVGLNVVGNSIVETFFYTKSDVQVANIMKTVKSFGFVYKSNVSGNNGVSYTYYSKPLYNLSLMKKYYDDENQASFFVTINKEAY